MATYYIDFENGNDANAGTSCATRWKTITNGATSARIAPGDEIRIMASPDPTSIGNATWTGGGRPAVINISSSTNATPIVITTASAHGLVPGDYVSVTNHNTNTNANGVWKVGTTPTSTTFQILQLDGSNTTGNGTGTATGNIAKANNLIVKTASPLVQNIALCGGLGQKPAWTASANVTATTTTANSTYKEGYAAASITLAGAFTTGKAAYYTLPSTLDLSGYQQVSFWVNLNTGTVGAAGAVYVALCTDTTGDTVAHQCPVPNVGANNSWVPVTVNLGTNLNSAIKSVAFYVATDTGAQTFYLDNIVACKASSSADSLNLQSLISKSDGTGDEAWYPIQSINYDAIMLANYNSLASNSTSIRGYSGTSETVTTYKRETVKTPIATATSTQVSVINDAGTSGSPITFSGGWNRTDMSTQTGRTWLDGLNCLGYGVASTSRAYTTLDKLDVCRYNIGLYFNTPSSGTVVSSTYCAANSQYGFFLSGASTSLSIGDVRVNNNNIGLYITTCTGANIPTVKSASNNSGSGVTFYQSFSCNVSSITAYNCSITTAAGCITFDGSQNCVVGTVSVGNTIVGGVSASFANNCYVNGGSITNATYGVVCGTATTMYLNNVVNSATTEVYGSTVSGIVYANRLDDTDGNNWIWQTFAGTINQQTSVVDSPATTAWLMRPTTTSATSENPLRLKLGAVVCAANSLVTVTARMRRSNTGLTMRLICPGGQISGVSSDVTSDMTASANTWETVTITFTPTKAGGVEIYAYAFGGSTYSGYVCNLTASQA